jgi:hypothetical protein
LGVLAKSLLRIPSLGYSIILSKLFQFLFIISLDNLRRVCFNYFPL